MKEAETIYEQLGGTYREENDNLLLDVNLPEQKPIGKYGRMHLNCLSLCVTALRTSLRRSYDKPDQPVPPAARRG